MNNIVPSRGRPVPKVSIDLGYMPRHWQYECHMAWARFNVFVLHRRAGKTELALRALVHFAMRFDKPMGLFVYLAPLLKQSKAIAWLRIQAILQPLLIRGMVEFNQSELWVRFTHNGAMIRLYGADNPDALRGVRLDGIVVDEVAQVKPELWDEVLQPALADRLGWATFIGTVNGINLFSKLYFEAEGQPQWVRRLYTVYDTDTLNPDEIERLRRTMSDIAFRREFLCDFTAAGNEQLISLGDVEAAAGRHLTRDQYGWAPIILGVDPARFGDDSSVICVRQGLLVRDLRVYHKVDNIELAGYVALAQEETGAQATFIDAGNGAGVIDKLRQMGRNVLEVPFAGKPANPVFLNKRAEMWFAVREWIGLGGSIPRNRELMQDLAAPTYGFSTGTDKIYIESKDDLKSRGLPSPDRGDALALTFAHPVTREASLAHRMSQETGIPEHMFDSRSHIEYDPTDSNFASNYDPIRSTMR